MGSRRPLAHFCSLLSREWFNLRVLLPFMSQAASLLPLISKAAQNQVLLVGPASLSLDQEAQ